MSRVKRAKWGGVAKWEGPKSEGVRVTRFLHDHPDLTQLFLTFTKCAVEDEAICTAIEQALHEHRGMTDLEICVECLFFLQAIVPKQH